MAAGEEDMSMGESKRDLVKPVHPHAWLWEPLQAEVSFVSRSMFGTNLPVDRLFAPGKAIVRAYETAAKNLSEAERDALFRRNAERAYRI